MYKRTHSSISALADAEFLRTYFGLRITYNESFAANDDAYWEGWTPGENSGRCATRVVQEVLPNFEIHFFESAVTPQGSPEGEIPMEEWVAYFERLHNGFAAHEDYDSWDAFMSNRMTFYAPDLSPFVRGLRGGGVPTFNAVYEHTLDVDGDHPKGSSGKVRVYSCSVVVPGTGQLFEVISEGLVDELKGAFDGDKIWRDWPAASCPSSNYVRQSVMELRTLWHNAGGRMKGDSRPAGPARRQDFVPGRRRHVQRLPADARALAPIDHASTHSPTTLLVRDLARAATLTCASLRTTQRAPGPGARSATGRSTSRRCTRGGHARARMGPMARQPRW